MTYDPTAISKYFDELGLAEWERFDRTLGDRVSLQLHIDALERFVPRGSRVLEIGAGPGRFTEVLHGLGCRIVVSDLSPRQLELNREIATQRGFAASVESWVLLDICDLGSIEDQSFDAVVALGGPLSYVFDQRARALGECRRVVRPGGAIVCSVMSRWGTMRRHLDALLALSPAQSRAIAATGDLTPETDPSSKHHCHLFGSAELRSLFEDCGFGDVWLCASSALSTGRDSSLVAPGSSEWMTLLEHERVACTQDGCLDAGTHLIAAGTVT